MQGVMEDASGGDGGGDGGRETRDTRGKRRNMGNSNWRNATFKTHTHTRTQAHTHLHDAHEDDFLGLKVCADEAGLRDGKRNAIDTLRSAGRVRG